MSDPSWWFQPRGASRLTAAWEALAPDAGPQVDLPLLGVVSAGRPILACEDSDSIPLPAALARRADFALRVRGQSMTGDQIEDGDLVLVRRQPQAGNGETVVALIGGAEVTLKRLYVEAGGIRLQPANPETAPLYLPPGEVEVLGLVTGVLRWR